jgi:hypothetical protein
LELGQEEKTVETSVAQGSNGFGIHFIGQEVVRRGVGRLQWPVAVEIKDSHFEKRTEGVGISYMRGRERRLSNVDSHA